MGTECGMFAAAILCERSVMDVAKRWVGGCVYIHSLSTLDTYSINQLLHSLTSLFNIRRLPIWYRG